VGTEGLKEIAQTPPTIQVAAGAVIHILVVQDIDFSQVYGFKKNYH
jgi:type IV secretory pathway VirB10-like protein